MAYVKLGSKPEVFHREGQSWQCTSGLPSDVTVEIGELSFHLHKFPLMSRSGVLEKRIGELTTEDGSISILQLSDIPGGAKSFELIAKFCYGVKMELTALNVVGLRCAAEYLQMTEDFGEGNLISQTEAFLNEVFGNWADTVKALKTCEEVLSAAEEVHVVSRCINSLATKACADISLFNWPVSSSNNAKGTTSLNGNSPGKKTPPLGDDWWYEDVSYLSLPIYRRLIQAVDSIGMKPERISGSVVYYSRKHIPSINRRTPPKETEPQIEPEQGALLEEIVELLPSQKGVTPTKYLFSLLRAAIILNASPSCRENLEKRAGVQLENASLEDLLIPNIDDSIETLYDIDCVQRILDHFMTIEQQGENGANSSSPCNIVEEGESIDEASVLMSTTMVANLVDAFLADVAPDVNLKLAKFQSVAAAVPDCARPIADGIYRAIDIYLKAHPWLTDSEREQICRLMNCQKLSLEASTHAAQNERLPLRVIIQVLFFEQLRLRTSISGWLFVSDNIDNSQNPNTNLALTAHDRAKGVEDMRDLVRDLEKECQTIRQEIQKLGSAKRSWNFIWRRKPQKSKESKAAI